MLENFWIQKHPHPTPRIFPLRNQEAARIIKLSMENLPEVVPGDPADLPTAPSRKIATLYRSELAERISDLYLEGKSLRSISMMPEMPSYSTIMKWLKQNPEFRALIDGARATRALHFEEEAINAAELCVDKDDAPAARLKFDAYRWGAEVSDPTRFGKRTTIAGDPDKPVQFIISTGFPEPNEAQRPPELAADGTIKRRASPEVIEATATVLQDVTEDKREETLENAHERTDEPQSTDP